jgi:hypothetical protein
MGQRAAAQDQRSEVDQPVAGRDERRHVVQPVDVDPEPAGEDVLHRRGVEHHDRHLDAGGPALPAQRGEEQQPGAETEEALLDQRRPGVEPEDDDHPESHHSGYSELRAT